MCGRERGTGTGNGETGNGERPLSASCLRGIGTSMCGRKRETGNGKRETGNGKEETPCARLFSLSFHFSRFTFHDSVVFPQIHSAIKRCDFLFITIEHQCR